MGIQIVYDVEVETAVRKAEKEDKPLLIYSWLPRGEVMTDRRFVRVTLESFYHCKFPSLATQQKAVATGERNMVKVPSRQCHSLLPRPPGADSGSCGCFPHSTWSASAARDTRGTAWCFRHPVPEPPMPLPLTIQDACDFPIEHVEKVS